MVTNYEREFSSAFSAEFTLARFGRGKGEGAFQLHRALILAFSQREKE